MTQKTDFISLINQHQKIIFKVCNLYLNNDHDKKDLYQDIMLAAWKSYGSFRGDARFSTWLYRVALNTAITFFRKSQRRPSLSAFDDTALVNAPAAEIADNATELALLHESISKLSGIEKALIILYIEEYAYTEIAEMLGITVNHVAVKMNRIKLKLKTDLNKTRG